MEHKVNLNEISDGSLYRLNDMVRLGCDSCHGTSSCCRFAQDTITLDPFDIYELTLATSLSFEELFARQLISLSPADKLLMPHLKFSSDENACPFLETSGLCGIHDHRPGLCRLFPLARYFHDNMLHYIHQIHECPYSNAPKIKIKKWLGVADSQQYESFLLRWNKIVTDTKAALKKAADNAELSALTTAFLKRYFFSPYDTTKDFYSQFEARDR